MSVSKERNPMTLYTCQQRKNGNFIMSKLDDDMNVDGFYIMEKRGNAMTCSCASHKPYCKHMDVLVLMLERKHD